MSRRLRSSAGRTTAEYMGVLLIVAVVIGTFALTDVGERIGYHARILVCKIAQGENCDAIAGNPDAPAPAKCVVSSSDKSIQASVKVFVVKLEGGVTAVYRVSADGTTYVTLQANAGAGLAFSTPGVEAGVGARYFENGDVTYFFSGLLGSINKVGGSGVGQAGKRIEFLSELDLRDPANRAAARAFIDGINPATGGVVDATQASIDLFERFDAAAQTNVRLYDIDKTELGVDVDGSVLGFSAKYSQSDADLTDAYFDPRPRAAAAPRGSIRTPYAPAGADQLGGGCDGRAPDGTSSCAADRSAAWTSARMGTRPARGERRTRRTRARRAISSIPASGSTSTVVTRSGDTATTTRPPTPPGMATASGLPVKVSLR